MHKTRGWMRGVAAIAVLGLLGGCASIPVTGTPKHVADVDTDTTGGYVITPPGPASGDSAEDVILGFIEAGTGFSNDYAIAREYLTSSFSSQWNSAASVLVYDGQPTVKVHPDGTATVTLSVGASIDEEGHLTELSTNSDVSQTFSVVQENGEWRIASAPDGVSIIRPRFALIYTQQTLYFYDPDFSYRVPDVRWIANTPWAATRLVQLLLKGPSAWLSKGVVASAFPDGTQLAVDTIPTSSSVTTVELSTQALSADTKDRQLMLLQLQSTLSGLTSISKVQISVSGAVVPIDDLGANAPIVNPAPQSQRLIVDDEGVLSYLADNGSTEPVGGLADLVETEQLTSFSLRGAVAAATSARGVRIAVSGGESDVKVSGAPARDASIDPHSFVWAVSGGSIGVWDSAGAQVSVSMSWLGGTVISARLSRDGTRLALLVKEGSQISAMAAGVIRDKDGKPSELAKPLTLTSFDNGATSVVWYSDQDLAVLSSTKETSTVTLLSIGGESTTKTSTTAATAIAAGSGEDTIRLLLANGDEMAPRGSSWLQVAKGVSVIGYSW